MKNIIIIGNGFDRAHDLPTSYVDFIDDFILSELKDENSDLLVPFVLYSLGKIANKTSPKKQGVYIDKEKKSHRFMTMNFFLVDLLKQQQNGRDWCDIEGFYYEALQKINERDLEKFQNDFKLIKQKLIDYLNFLNIKAIPNDNFKHFFGHNYFCNPKNNLILNFNFTDTLEKLYSNELTSFKINQVHGALGNLPENEIVFGHDISRQAYDEYISEGKHDKFFDNIKFLKYRLNSSLEDLNSFLDEFEPFNLFIIGHSCSISDKIMLETILSNPELNQVSIFYYKEPESYEVLRRSIDKIMIDTGINIDKKIKSIRSQIPTPQFSDDDILKKSINKKIEELFSQNWFIKSPYGSEIR